MTSHEILHADPLDILFEHRNKSYGAYALRREYNHRLLLGMGLAFSLSLIAFIWAGNSGDSPDRMPKSDEGGVIVTLVDPPKPEEPEPQPKPKVPVATKQFTSQILLVKNNVPTDVPEMEELTNKVIGTQDVDGIVPTSPEQTSGDPAPDPGPAPEAPKQPEAPAEPPAPPMFPGGQEAWLLFLQENLVAPDDLGPGERKTVLVEFLVDEDGKVTRFKVLQSAGSVFDNEVVRVLRRMPRWKPARQNGQPVAVPFKQPVTFVGVEP